MKKMTSILLLLLAATISLTGCNEADTSHPPKTVGWFFEHRNETPSCINANEARNKVTVQEMKDALK